MGSPRVQGDTAAATGDPPRSGGTKKGRTAGASRGAARLPSGSKSPSPNGRRRARNGDSEAVGAPASKRVLRSQGRRTMRKLLDAAMVAFDERGYHATRVNDVVEIAKTSHGTFYLYFSNKEDLLRALVTEAAGEAQGLYDALNTLPAEGGAPQWDDVYRWVKAFSDLWHRYAPLFRAWTDLATIDPELVDIIRETFTALSGALSRQISPDSSGHVIDPDVAGMATLAMLDRFHYFLEFVGHPIDEVTLETMTTILYRAFIGPNA
jgi:AcrR family transcriptional regulator